MTVIERKHFITHFISQSPWPGRENEQQMLKIYLGWSDKELVFKSVLHNSTQTMKFTYSFKSIYGHTVHKVLEYFILFMGSSSILAKPVVWKQPSRHVSSQNKHISNQEANMLEELTN